MLRTSLLFAALLTLSTSACDSGADTKGDASRPTPEAKKEEAKPAKPAKPAAEAKQQDVQDAAGANAEGGTSDAHDAEICQHIMEITHTELGHLDEMDPEIEKAALDACASQVHHNRENFGIAFAAVASRTMQAGSLAGIAACEDHYAGDIGGEETLSQFSIEMPIVDAEVCMHRLKVNKEATMDKCRAELDGLRKKVGNVRFDAQAGCMMNATDEAAFMSCEEPLMSMAPLEFSTPEVKADDGRNFTPANALEELEKIRVEACGCGDIDCATEARNHLDEWVRAAFKAGGSLTEEEQAEAIFNRIIECETKIAGAHWLDESKPAK